MPRQLLKIAFVAFAVFLTVDASSQIMTFDFVSLAGNEASAASNFNDPNISAGAITRGAGLTAAANGQRFNATNWSTVSIPNAVTNNQYMQFTITPAVGCNFSVSSIVIQLQRSASGPSAVALRSSADGFTANLDAIYTIVDNTTTQTFTFTFTQTAITVATTYRFYMFAEAAAGSGGIGDGAGNDIVVNGSTSCSAPTSITTGAVSGGPFTVECTTSTTDAGSVAFTSTGTFGAANIYTVQLSDASGSFASPTSIGTLASTANSGSINFTIPAATPTGAAYLVRVVSDDPVVTGVQSAAFTITQSTPCPAYSITTGIISTAPFTVDCTASTTDAGSVAFTSTGVFGVGNIYTVQLSDASGSFASPTSIGTLASTANSGSINFTIPATVATGAAYLLRIVSDNPVTTGSSSAAFTITQSTPCVPVTPTTPGLIINEWSNGPSGNQEYYEFVVAGQCGTLVDIQGYILDDNNGTFTAPASYSGTPSGIAPGHFRFAYDPQWAAIPVGSLIVIYNNEDPNPSLPADDPTDANSDSLYVVPHDNALFERCITLPGTASPDSIYTPCTYAVSPFAGWSPLSLRNGGDAIQIRNTDGSYYHGVSYGGAEISGGPHNLKLFAGSGTAMAGWFSAGDFYDIANWSSGSVTGNETPGIPNNVANADWLQLMRDLNAATCPIAILPVELSDFSGKKMADVNVLHWETQSENNSSYFTLERSSDVKTWEVISMEPAAGSSQSKITYSHVDNGFRTGQINYYRLSQTDFDGSTEVFQKIVSIDNRIQKVSLVKIVNLLGQEIDENTSGVQIHVYSDGTAVRYFK